MASEEDAGLIFAGVMLPTEQYFLLRERIATALTAARAETWKEAITEVRNVVKGWRSDVDESWDERPDLSFEAADKVAGAMEIVTALEAAAGNTEAEDRKAAVIRRGKE